VDAVATSIREFGFQQPIVVDEQLVNRVIFRLACCCGLRASEIAHLQLADVHTSETRPHLVVRGAIAKGQKPRAVPLWWDRDTLADLSAWKANRVEQTTNLRQPFVAC
jgi:integrase